MKCCSYCTGNRENFWLLFKLEKTRFSLLQYYVAAKMAKKHLLKLTEHLELNSFTNMVAKIDISTFKFKNN